MTSTQSGRMDVGDNGLEYSEDCIVVSNGAKQAAWQAVVSMCGEGDEVDSPGLLMIKECVDRC